MTAQLFTFIGSTKRAFGDWQVTAMHSVAGKPCQPWRA